MSVKRPMRAAILWLTRLGLCLLALRTAPAAAHPGEFLRTLVLHPTDPKVFALRYEAALGGLLFSRDGGKSLRIVPGQSFYKYPLRWQVPLLMAGDGKLQIALDDELHSDDGTGCDLTHSEAPIAGALISDLAAHPSDPQINYVLTTPDIVSGTDAKPSHTGIWRRDSSGITPVGNSDGAAPTIGAVPFRPTSLRVIARAASTNGLRFIEAGLAADPAQTMARQAVVRVSDDGAATWSTHVITSGDAGDSWPQILVVSSDDPFKALVSLQRGLGEDDDDPFDSIYLTKDGAQTFTLYSDKIQIGGEAVLLPSGQILLGDRGIAGGLWSAPNFESAPTRVQDFRVHCLAYQPATKSVYACKRYELGIYDPTANDFCALFTMTDAAGMVSCPAAPLEQNEKAVHQLCNGYCSAQHFAEAPLCGTFDVGTLLCGPSADAWDREYGYLPPHGTLASPRCAGFPQAMHDGGVAGALDAGEDAGEDASVENEQDAEADPNADESGAVGDEATDEGDEAVEDGDESEDGDLDDAGAQRRKRRGCHCTLADARDDGEPLLLTLLFSLAFVARRRRR